ncbi:caspase family protein [Streptomyces cinnabarinus]|uniref:Caspase family protein n=1 Tax=Streptomyces cinnabarinus TaxID=67287 RepID=A0ABY7KQU4_9ACTN|nr:caspase family protein [Streptomyces cinnabarinus]WAZ26724.1 caspase family protein [Streptomyces cinnabarinus]
MIGVGGYPHLASGARARGRVPRLLRGLGPLTSPPRSALAFARHLVDGTDGIWQTPLRSVDVLLSWAADDTDGLGQAASVQASPAGLDDIREAFERWTASCSTDPDNVGILYFCGHGLQSDGQILLADDINRFAESPFAQAFDFDRTRLALQQRGPRTQFFVIDACRVGGSGDEPPAVLALADRTVFGLSVRQNELTVRMPPYSEATGYPEQVSHLTSALIKALDGQAAETDDAGEWVVRMEGISGAINTLLMRELGVEALDQGVETTIVGDAVLYRLHEAPAARLTVRCLPPEAASRTKLTCVPHEPPDSPHIHGGQPVDARPTADGERIRQWELHLRAGVYTVRAACDEAAAVSRCLPVWPPHSRTSLRVAP